MSNQLLKSENLRARRIALIGGAGFVGHNLALFLKKRNYIPFIVDHFEVNNKFVLEIKSNPIKMGILEQRLKLLKSASISIIRCDARNQSSLLKVIRNIKPEIVIHLAAISHANKCNNFPQDAFENNLLTLQNALEVSREEKIKQFIFFSSSMVYGDFESGIVTEASKCNPKGIYASQKISGEYLLKAYHQVFGVNYTIIRPSALYGERCISRRVTQAFIEDAMTKNKITINGDGLDCLDFTYIQDLMSGIIKVIDNEKAFSETFNLTFGKARPINDLVKILKSYYPKLQVEYLPKDKLMPDRGTLSVIKARKMIGYVPQYPLEKGYKKYIEWMINNVGLAHNKQ